MRIELRARDSDLDAVIIAIDPASVELAVAGEHTTFAHDGDGDRLGVIGEAVADTVRAAVTRARKLDPTREA